MSESTELPPATSPQPTPPHRSWLRRLYDWVLHWAYTPYALPALFILSFAESSFFPIPPDVLLIPLVLGNRAKSWKYATWCSIASVLGGIAGYFLGMFLWQQGLDEFCFKYIPGFTAERFDKVEGLFKEYNFWVVFAAGFTPIPYKIITVAAGVFAVPFVPFVIASAVGRSARFFLVAALLRKYGEPIRTFIEKRLGMVTIAFCVLLIGGFALVKLVL